MPHTGYFSKTRSFKQRIIHGGSFLLSKGGAGDASSYSSPEEYRAITGRGMGGKGHMSGCGFDALQNLEIRSKGKKPKNIQF